MLGPIGPYAVVARAADIALHPPSFAIRMSNSVVTTRQQSFSVAQRGSRNAGRLCGRETCSGRVELLNELI